MAWKFIDQESPAQEQVGPSQEGLLGTVGRNVARSLPEFFGAAYGAPGDIINLLTQGANWGLRQLPGELQIPEIAGKYIPTSEQLINLAKEKQAQVHGRGFEQPQNSLERILSSGTKFAGGMAGSSALLAPFGAAPTLKNVAKTAAQAGVGGEAISQLFGEENRDLGEALGAVGPDVLKLGYSIFNPNNLQKSARTLFAKATKEAPEVPFKATPLRNLYDEVNVALKKGIKETDHRHLLDEIFDQLGSVVKNNQVDASDLIRWKEDANKIFEKGIKQGDSFKRKWSGKLTDAIRTVFEENKSKAPEFVNDYLTANDLYRAYYDRISIGDILKKFGSKGGLIAASPTIAAAFKAGTPAALSTAAGTLGAGALGALGTEGYNVAKSIMKYPNVRRHYQELINASAAGNEVKMVNAYKKFAQSFEKQNKGKSGQTEWRFID